MNKQSGFSLIEILVSLGIVGIVSAFVTPAFIAQNRSNKLSEIRGLAITATDQRFDMMRAADPATLPDGGEEEFDVAVGGIPFVLRVEYCVNSAWCSAVTRHLRITAIRNGQIVHESETVFTQLR